jgi:hypothetical protein
MCSGDEVLEILHAAEVIFDIVFINSAVAVIVGGCIVILIERRQPQSCHSQVLQIRQVLLNTLQVSAVVGMQ